MGGFCGKLGPAVGYMWNGRWCVRSYQPVVHNPRTEAQTAHRDMFKAEVQLAASMRWAVTTTLTASAREAGMTSYNMFVHLNQAAFGREGGRLAVDWSRLQLSAGAARGVAFEAPERTADNVVTVRFGRGGGAAYDMVHLYAYCPATGTGYLAAPVYRKAKSVSVVLPDAMAGREVQLFGMVQDQRGEWSATEYVGGVTVTGPTEEAQAGMPAHQSEALHRTEKAQAGMPAYQPTAAAAVPEREDDGVTELARSG